MARNVYPRTEKARLGFLLKIPSMIATKLNPIPSKVPKFCSPCLNFPVPAPGVVKLLILNSPPNFWDRMLCQCHWMLLHLWRQSPDHPYTSGLSDEAQHGQIHFEDNAEFGLGFRLAVDKRKFRQKNF